MLLFGFYSIISEIKAFEKIYRKYISEMKGSHSKGKGCPLCHREFGSAKELHQLIDEVRICSFASSSVGIIVLFSVS